MFEYVVEIKQPVHGTTFVRSGHGIFEKDQINATRFQSYYEALQHILGVFADRVLKEPAEIRIAPAPNEDWSIEEILAREG